MNIVTYGIGTQNLIATFGLGGVIPEPPKKGIVVPLKRAHRYTSRYSISLYSSVVFLDEEQYKLYAQIQKKNKDDYLLKSSVEFANDDEYIIQSGVMYVDKFKVPVSSLLKHRKLKRLLKAI
jgi:hypothetical protein